MFEFIKKYFKKQEKQLSFECALCGTISPHKPNINAVYVNGMVVRVCDCCYKEE